MSLKKTACASGLPGRNREHLRQLRCREIQPAQRHLHRLRRGLYQPAMAGTACEQCGFENYSASGASSCTPCPRDSKGRYQNNTEASDCLCKPGFTGTNDDQNGCQPCKAGQYKAVLGAEACKPCAAGSFQDQSASPACKPCQPHHWSHEHAVQCQRCPAENAGGFNLTSWSLCDCLPGFHASISGDVSLKNTTDCEACPAGKFKHDEGYDILCTDCDIGKFSNARNATDKTTCRHCAKNNTSRGSETCSDCREFPSPSTNMATNLTACASGVSRLAQTLSSASDVAQVAQAHH